MGINSNLIQHSHIDADSIIASRQTEIYATLLLQNNEILHQMNVLSIKLTEAVLPKVVSLSDLSIVEMPTNTPTSNN